MLEREGVEAEIAAFDVTGQNAVIAGVEKIESEYGPIDILINNAGIQRRAPLDQFSRADWDALINTNLNAVFFVGQAVAKHMLPRGQGRSSISVRYRANWHGQESHLILPPRGRSKT